MMFEKMQTLAKSRISPRAVQCDSQSGFCLTGVEIERVPFQKAYYKGRLGALGALPDPIPAYLDISPGPMGHWETWIQQVRTMFHGCALVVLVMTVQPHLSHILFFGRIALYRNRLAGRRVLKWRKGEVWYWAVSHRTLQSFIFSTSALSQVNGFCLL